MEEEVLHKLDDDLKKYFPDFDFKLKDFQKKVISNVIEHGNTLCIMPTGGGKSLIYWMSALELGGISIVVSPLTALISEQAAKIEAQGYDVLAIHGGVSAIKQMKLLTDLANKKTTPQFIFLSPEKIATDGFLEYCLACRKEDIKLLVIDEVHCVSQWGMSFRPFYKRIPDFMNQLFGENKWCKILALTATINPKELGDICNSFHINKSNIIIQDLLMRSEIQLHTQKFSDEKEKVDKFWEIIKTHQDEKILVYVYRKYSKNGVEDLCVSAIERGYKAVTFHGDMSAAERTEIIDKFKTDQINIVFATNAFGMGIDIPNIRVVIHFMIPESVEQYYQEVGRAARDGHGANAYLLYSNKNIEVKKRYFIDGSFPTKEKLESVYKKIAIKPGYATLSYFDDEEIQQCLPYYLDAGLLEIACKGFADLKSLELIKDPVIEKYYNCTKKKGFILTAKKCSVEPKHLAHDIYSAIVNGTAVTKKALERWIILKIHKVDIEETDMEQMLSCIEERKKYKHGLLDYFVFVLDNNSSSLHLHQEIASYLGTDKHNLNKIYETVDGKHVRSKSEVIICNLLHESGLEYQYEEKLFYDNNKWIEPDFTIKLSNNRKIYWEHVGMLGKEDYDTRWSQKIDIYNRYFPGCMVKTYESGSLSKDVKYLIEKIKTL